VVQKKIAQSLMHCHFATVISRIVFFTKMLRRDQHLPVNAKFVSGSNILW